MDEAWNPTLLSALKGDMWSNPRSTVGVSETVDIDFDPTLSSNFKDGTQPNPPFALKEGYKLDAGLHLILNTTFEGVIQSNFV